MENYFKCTKCNQIKSNSEFAHHGEQRSTKCKQCKREYNIDRARANGVAPMKKSIMVGNNKICLRCDIEKELIEFGLSDSGVGGVKCNCKQCEAEIALLANRAKGIPEKIISIVINDTKSCTRCSEFKLFSDFYPDKKGINGLGSHCKQCMGNYKEVYINENSEKLKETRDNWRSNNPEYSREWHSQNPNYNKQHYKENSDDAKERASLWAKENPGKIARNSTKQRAGDNFLEDNTATEEFISELYANENCYYCGKLTPLNERSQDHKIPISRGGIHSANNLVMACIYCNKSKFNNTDKEFICIIK